MKKKILIKPRNELKNTEERLDKWISSPIEQEKTINSQIVVEKNVVEKNNDDYRFTMIIPLSLHQKIKKHCVTQRISIKDCLTRILEREFPDI